MKRTAKNTNEVRKRMIDWAKEHNWVINPSKGMEIYVENYLRFGFCPCDSSRLTCPCEESIVDMEKWGHCRCRLYWKDLDTFKDTLRAGEKEDEGIATTQDTEAD